MVIHFVFQAFFARLGKLIALGSKKIFPMYLSPSKSLLFLFQESFSGPCLLNARYRMSHLFIRHPPQFILFSYVQHICNLSPSPPFPCSCPFILLSVILLRTPLCPINSICFCLPFVMSALFSFPTFSPFISYFLFIPLSTVFETIVAVYGSYVQDMYTIYVRTYLIKLVSSFTKLHAIAFIFFSLHSCYSERGVAYTLWQQVQFIRESPNALR